MTFETYDPVNLWKRYRNNVVNPLGGDIPFPSTFDNPSTISNTEGKLGDSLTIDDNIPTSTTTIDSLKINNSRGIYNSINLPIPDLPSDVRRSNIYLAGARLAENLKRAALNEAQRRLDQRFRLLNDTIDRIRNSYGIGRMREPTNVYNITQQNLFFFDVRNSLRDFAGDTLTGLIGGRRP
jgi:hypothetical protein